MASLALASTESMHTSKWTGTQIFGNADGHKDNIYQTKRCQMTKGTATTHPMALTLGRDAFLEALAGVYLLRCLK